MCITVNADKALKSVKSFVNLRNMESSWKLLLRKVPENPSQNAWKVTDSCYVSPKAPSTLWERFKKFRRAICSSESNANSASFSESREKFLTAVWYGRKLWEVSEHCQVKTNEPWAIRQGELIGIRNMFHICELFFYFNLISLKGCVKSGK